MMLNTLKLSRLASNCTDLVASVSLCQQNSKTVTKVSASNICTPYNPFPLTVREAVNTV